MVSSDTGEDTGRGQTAIQTLDPRGMWPGLGRGLSHDSADSDSEEKAVGVHHLRSQGNGCWSKLSQLATGYVTHRGRHIPHGQDAPHHSGGAVQTGGRIMTKRFERKHG